MSSTLRFAFLLVLFAGTAQAQPGATDSAPTIPCRGADCPCPGRRAMPFDLGAHGVNFALHAVVVRGCDRQLLVYDPGLRVAALVDVRTGLAEVAWNFTADVVDDAVRGPVVFDDVELLDGEPFTGLWFVWWHHGAAWSHQWPSGRLPVIDLTTFLVGGVPLFRWR